MRAETASQVTLMGISMINERGKIVSGDLMNDNTIWSDLIEYFNGDLFKYLVSFSTHLVLNVFKVIIMEVS